MATFTFEYQGETIQATIPDDVMAVTIDAVAVTYGYREEVPDPSAVDPRNRQMIPNPQSKLQFMLVTHLIGHLNQITRDYVMQQALAQAAAQASAPQIEV